MNTPVNFELAKLLKEKWFPFLQKETYYNPVNGFTSYEEINPTIAQVLMWLYEKHGVWINVYSIDDSTIFRHCFSNIDFNSPTEAYEAAIEYTLKNII